MECPYCGKNLKQPPQGRCPHCGRGLHTSLLGVIKTASVRVAAGEEDRVYQSLEDIPPELRHQLRQAIQGPHSETIIIADEAGRQRIFEAITGLPPHLQKKVLAALHLTEPSRPRLSRRFRWALLAAGFLTLAVFVAWLWV